MSETLDLDPRDAAIIAKQNDRFRQALGLTGDVRGRCVITQALSALGPELQRAALREVAAFNTFTPDNDPYEFHEMGSVQIAEHCIFWRIDLYDTAYRWGAETPTDLAATRRVLTIMLAGDL